MTKDKRIDEMLKDKQTMTMEQLCEKYDLNTKWRRVRHLPKSEDDLKFYTLESFHNSYLNEYKFNLQNDPNLKTNILAVYITVSREYPLPYVTTIEYYPENESQAQSLDLLNEIMLEQMAKYMRINYGVRICLIYYGEDKKETLVSYGSSFEGERRLKVFDVIRMRLNGKEDKISFKETDKMDSEYLNFYYSDPKEEEKKREFDKLKDSMGGV